MIKNSKTTILGAITVLSALLNAVQNMLTGAPVDWTATVAAITAGIGLIMAKDHNVTGGTIKQ